MVRLGRRTALAARARLSRSVRSLEAGAAGAALDRVRVEDREAALHDVFGVVHFGAVEQLGAVEIDHDLDAAALDHKVALFGTGGERHPILIAGAAAADDKDAERALGHTALFEQRLRLDRCLFRY